MKLATLRYAKGAWSRPFPDLDAETTVVLAFAAAAFGARPAPFIELAAAYPRAAVLGCSGAGEIEQTRIHEDSIVVSVVQFEHSRVKLAEAAGMASANAAARIAEALQAPDLRAVLVLASGLEPDALLSELGAQLPRVTVTGGVAGGRAPWLLARGGWIAPAAVAAVGLYGDRVAVRRGEHTGDRIALAAGPSEGPVLCVAIAGARSEPALRATLEALPVGAAQVGFHTGLPHPTTITVISERA